MKGSKLLNIWIVIECVPSIVAKKVTEALQIPVIGIGAGPHTSGQILVYHDLLVGLCKFNPLFILQ